MKRNHPPRLAVLILSAVLPSDDADSILGDLSEVYSDRRLTGRLGAFLWFWGEVVIFSTAFAFDGVRQSRHRTVASSSRKGSNWNMISHRLWQVQFGGDADIVGKPVVFDGNPRPVIGVLPPDFARRLGTGSQLSSTIDVWSPLPIIDHRNFWGYPSIARLRNGVSFRQANLALEFLVRDLVEEYPDRYSGASLGFRIHPLLPDLVRESRPAIRAALAGVILMLVVAIMNSTALVVARLKTREAEFAIRSAIGARWGALVRDVFSKSLTLTLLGGVLGGGIAAAAIAGLKAVIPKTVPRWDAIALGWDLIGYTALLALVALLSAGLIPALKAGRSRPWDVIGGASHQRGSSRAATRFVLVGTQLAMAVVLTFGAVQLASSATHLLETELPHTAS